MKEIETQQVPLLTPELKKDLMDLYQTYRPRNISSPYLGCLDMSIVIKAEFGLLLVEGHFQTDSGRLIPHYWNEDRDSIIIDFTRHQFNKNLPQALQIPFDQLAIIYPADLGYALYTPKRPRVQL